MEIVFKEVNKMRADITEWTHWTLMGFDALCEYARIRTPMHIERLGDRVYIVFE